jgi:hypothetical protein
VGYADLEIATLAHGARGDRCYGARHRLLTEFDPAREVACEERGALAWTASGERRRTAVAAYFRARNEDGIPPQEARATTIATGRRDLSVSRG